MQRYYTSKSRGNGINAFVLLVIALLIASTNLGLLNRFVALQTGTGENLVGLRDGLMALVIIFGLLSMSRMRKTAASNPLTKITLMIVYLTPIAAAIGLMNGADLLTAIRSLVIMFGWLLVWVIASNLNNPKSVYVLSNAVMVIGLLVAVGVYIEMITGGRVQVVTPADVVTQTGRSTPSGWPIMMVSISQLQALYLFDNNVTKRKQWARILGWFFILVASLLTQSRTLLLGIVVSALILIVLSIMVAPEFVRKAKARLLFIFALPVLAFILAVWLGSQYIRSNFGVYFLERYSVLIHQEQMLEKLEDDARRDELIDGFKAYLGSPLWGLGLASTYRFDYSIDAGSAVRMHNVYGFFLFRYGPAGLLLFILLIIGVCKSLIRALQGNSTRSTMQIGLLTGLINLFVCAYFGNVFATTYGTPQAMIVLALLVASEELTKSETKRVGFNARDLVNISPFKSAKEIPL